MCNFLPVREMSYILDDLARGRIFECVNSFSPR